MKIIEKAIATLENKLPRTSRIGKLIALPRLINNKIERSKYEMFGLGLYYDYCLLKQCGVDIQLSPPFERYTNQINQGA